MDLTTQAYPCSNPTWAKISLITVNLLLSLFSGAFGVARFLMQEVISVRDESASASAEPKKARIRRPRLLGHEPVTAIKNIKTSSFGKLITVTATVIR